MLAPAKAGAVPKDKTDTAKISPLAALATVRACVAEFGMKYLLYTLVLCTI
jgi:hypothetical protein